MRVLDDIYNGGAAAMIAVMRKHYGKLGLSKLAILGVPLPGRPFISSSAFRGNTFTVFNFPFAVDVKDHCPMEPWEVKALLPRISKSFQECAGEHEGAENIVMVDASYEKHGDNCVLNVQGVYDDGDKKTKKYIRKRLRKTRDESDLPVTYLEMMKMVYRDIRDTGPPLRTQKKNIALIVSGLAAFALFIIFIEKIKQFFAWSALIVGAVIWFAAWLHKQTKTQPIDIRQYVGLVHGAVWRILYDHGDKLPTARPIVGSNVRYRIVDSETIVFEVEKKSTAKITKDELRELESIIGEFLGGAMYPADEYGNTAWTDLTLNGIYIYVEKCVDMGLFLLIYVKVTRTPPGRAKARNQAANPPKDVEL